MVADYTILRLRSSLQDQVPAAFATEWVRTVATPDASPEFLNPLA